MSCVFFCEVLAHKDMSQVSSAISALDFRSYPVRVWNSFYCTRDFVIKAWPATVSFEFVFRTVEFCTATFANVGAFLPEREIFAFEGHFGPFVYYNLFLFRG